MSQTTFTANRITRSYRQTILALPDEIFPLLCPVREAEWLYGWQYEMIFSESGLIEEGAVFSTPHHDIQKSIWIVTRHDPGRYIIEFARFTPDSRTCILKINIFKKSNSESYVDISYTYTSVSDQGNEFIKNFTEKSFLEAVTFWEDAMNHYLTTGEILIPDK